jgi:hypothetical protein
MNCSNSFTLNINENIVFTSASGDLVTWNSLGTILPWTAVTPFSTAKSVFNVQGFKNIDVYGLSVVGIVRPQRSTATNSCLIEDWGVNISIDGTTPLINGFFGVNTFPAVQGGNTVFLSKYQNKYELIDPIQSVKSITIEALNASGIQYESSVSLDIAFNIAIIVYFKYEGEDY